MTYFDDHASRFLFFEPGEEVEVTLIESGPLALGRLNASGTGVSSDTSRDAKVSFVTDEPVVLIVAAAYAGTLSEILETANQVSVHWRGSMGTEYHHDLERQGGAGRWTYYMAVRQSDTVYYFCLDDCGKWGPSARDPGTGICPGCRKGKIGSVRF
jgi:hypothetical protein